MTNDRREGEDRSDRLFFAKIWNFFGSGREKGKSLATVMHKQIGFSLSGKYMPQGGDGRGGGEESQSQPWDKPCILPNIFTLHNLGIIF